MDIFTFAFNRIAQDILTIPVYIGIAVAIILCLFKWMDWDTYERSRGVSITGAMIVMAVVANILFHYMAPMMVLLYVAPIGGIMLIASLVYFQIAIGRAAESMDNAIADIHDMSRR